MKHIKIILLALAVVLIGTQEHYGQSISKAGTSAAEFLRIPVGARASAMSAMTATVNDASAAIYNPAGLADIEGKEIMLEYTDWYLDLNHTFLGVAIPAGKGVAGLNVVALNMGEFEETTVEAQGKTGRTFNAYSASIGASYAQYLIPQFSIGGSVKFIYEKIFNSSASTFAFDIGTLYETPFDGIKLGVSITNAGSKLQLDGDDLLISSDPDPNGGGNYEPDAKRATEAFNLPLMLRVGLAWDPYVSENIRTTITVDGNSPSNNVQSISVGGEIGLLNELIQIRGGVPYMGQDDRIETFNAGVGVRYKLDERLQLGINYTYHGYQYLSDVNKISLQIHF
ncbi:PorV/PorQ family protein [Balneola sp. MJW-20]|uniref:PorV/PorQ family protein n=1 Tax=Gracilimonas aurantiaca TaxID=3234185 RepID=UPI0034675B70